ncbi:MAG TPA: hypothetical protein PK819_08020 [Thermomicrobiales bacterium]|nr:hypothetical protein [Thermomicrobiales bacterium]
MSSVPAGALTNQDVTSSGERRDPRLDQSQTSGTVLETVHPPAYGRGLIVSIIAAAVVFALAIFASGGKETYTGIPMTQTTGALFWGLTVLAIVAVGLGAQYAEGIAARIAESLGQESRSDGVPAAWAVPAASMATALLLVATYHNRFMLIAGPLIAFFGVAGGLFARDLLEDVLEGTERTAALIHTVVIHVIAFLGLSAVYMNRMTGWYGAPIVFLLTGALIFEHLDRTQLPVQTRVLYTLLSSGIVAVALLAVNFWPTYGWTGGGALLLVFFVTAAMCSVRAGRGTLRERDLIEYGAIFLAGMIILAVTM